jgi:Mg2+ and Co2+ transporter CorA
MTDDQAITGTKDKHYDLISVVYHLLQGAETYQMYIEDAQQAGDQEIVQYFQEVQTHNRRLAQRGKALLLDRLSREQ